MLLFKVSAGTLLLSVIGLMLCGGIGPCSGNLGSIGFLLLGLAAALGLALALLLMLQHWLFKPLATEPPLQGQ
jgi:hypothetical protein